MGGAREKDVVLQIALRLARKLKEELGLDVVLTRSTDVFVELKERPRNGAAAGPTPLGPAES